MTEQNLLVVDSRPGLNAPTSRMIRKSEYRDIYPEKNHARTVARIFKYKKPEKIPVPEALFLVDKYEQLSLVDIKHQPISVEDALKMIEDGTQSPDASDDLTDMEYRDLVALAELFDITAKTAPSMKAINLKKEIRRLRGLGREPNVIEPVTDENSDGGDQVETV